MTRDEAKAILDMNDRDRAIEIIINLAEKAEKYDQLCGDISPTTPSGMTPTYLKPPHKRCKKNLAERKGIKA